MAVVLPFVFTGTASLTTLNTPLARQRFAEPGLTAWIVVALLWVLALLNYLDRLLITSMREAVEASIPMTEAKFGLLTSAFLWVYGIFSPYSGFMGDRFGRRWIILGSVFIWSLFTVTTGLAHSYPVLLLSRAGMGVSEACYLPAALALISDYHRGRTRSLATGLHMSGIYAGTALGGIGGYLAESVGWRAGFMILGAIGVSYSLLLIRFLRESPRDSDVTAALSEPRPASDPLRFLTVVTALASQRPFAILVVSNLLVGVSNWLVYGWLPTYLREHFRLGLGAAGLAATGYIQGMAFIGVLVGGVWADRWSVSNPKARIWVPAIGYLFAAPFLLLMARTDSLAVAIGALLLFGLGKGFYDCNLMPVVREIADERHSSTGYGILNSSSCLAGGVMTYLGGALRDQGIGLSLVFQSAAAGLLVVGILLLTLKPGPYTLAGSAQPAPH